MVKRWPSMKAPAKKAGSDVGGRRFENTRGSVFDAKVRSTTSRESDKFILRLPDGMREHLAEVAESQGRPMNAVVISALAEYLSGTKTPLETELAEIKAALVALTKQVSKQEPAA